MFIADKPYESMREMHGAFILTEHLIVFCREFSEILHHGQTDLMFVAWLTENVECEDNIDQQLYFHNYIIFAEKDDSIWAKQTPVILKKFGKYAWQVDDGINIPLRRPY